MKFNAVIVLGVVGLLPFCQAIILLTTGTAAATTATATTLAITLGSGSAAALAGAGVVAVAGALVLGGLALAAAGARNNKGYQKRSVDTNMCIPMEDPELFLTLAANADQFGCGLRLVCELVVTPEQSLSVEERLILNLFGRHVKPVSFSEMKNSKSGFQYAALVGSQAKSVAECAQVFDQCPFDRITIMSAFNQTRSQ